MVNICKYHQVPLSPVKIPLRFHKNLIADMRLPENGQTVHLRRRPCFAQVGRHPKAGWEWWIVGEWLMKLDETGWFVCKRKTVRLVVEQFRIPQFLWVIFSKAVPLAPAIFLVYCEGRHRIFLPIFADWDPWISMLAASWFNLLPIKVCWHLLAIG
jgi:hypothetical protein